MTIRPCRLADTLGESYPFARHIVEMTVVYIALLLCLWVTAKVGFLLFPVPNADWLVLSIRFLHMYADLAAIIGFGVWLSVDMLFLFRDRLIRGAKLSAPKRSRRQAKQASNDHE